MTNKIYTLYNTLSKRYGDVFVAPSDGMAEKNTRLYLTKGKGEDLKEFELCKIGEIDIETGHVTIAEGRTVVAWSESNVLPTAPTEEVKKS